ncbi:MAG: Toxin-antitoxin system antitoxin component, family [Hyphomicrobiales bacterium]|jgi:uncharacterized protein (DUF2384 family)|nr:Toxin-antitoxin system antitoxin component, family [Hyphomicrobiales bacterium]
MKSRYPLNVDKQKAQSQSVGGLNGAVRHVGVLSLAEHTFGERDKAHLWFRRGLSELGGEKPLDVAQTEAGVRIVENVLARIAWGAPA